MLPPGGDRHVLVSHTEFEGMGEGGARAHTARNMQYLPPAPSPPPTHRRLTFQRVLSKRAPTLFTAVYDLWGHHCLVEFHYTEHRDIFFSGWGAGGAGGKRGLA